MTTMLRGMGARALACLCLLLAVAGTPAMAQRFENVHGDNCAEEGYGGRRLTSLGNAGNYISVGVTYSTNPTSTSCANNTADIFVVKLDRLGQVIWQRRYDIGGNDIGYDVVELRGGNVAICGVTDNRGTACWTTANARPDGFIMRLDVNTGNVVWCCTYGSDSTDDGFRRVIQTRFAPAGQADSVGDLVAAGWSVNSNTSSGDGYMVRVNQNTGALVWNNTYAGRGDDEFRSLIETRVGNIQGDIVAVGSSTSWSTTGATNAWIVRCNGASGRIGLLPPYGSATYGDRVRSYLWSVVELTVNADSGSLVYVGGMVPNNLGRPEIYHLKTRAYPCVYVIDRRLGDNGTAHEEATTVRELTGLSSSSQLASGTLYTCGQSYIHSGFNGDAYATLVNPNTLALVGNFHLYGARSDERAWYIDYVPPVSGRSTEGFYVTGRAIDVGALPTLVPFPDPSQMYLLKTDNGLNTRCCDTIYTLVDSIPKLADSCVGVRIAAFGRRCQVRVDRDTIRRWRAICNDSTNVHNCGNDAGTDPQMRQGGAEDLSDNGATSAVDPDFEPAIRAALAVSSYPNPVRLGDIFSLRCDLRMASSLTVTIADMTGKVVYRSEGDQRAGSNLMNIPTREWRIGTYLVKVTAGNATETRRIVVSDK